MAETKKPLVFRDRDTKEKIPFYVKTEDVELPDGTDMGTKVAELEEAIGNAGDGTVKSVTINGTTVEPDANGDVELTLPEVEVDDTLDEESGNAVSNAAVTTAIEALRTAIETVIGEDATQAIENFKEVLDFLANVNDEDTLVGLLTALQTAIDGKVSKSDVVNTLDVTASGKVLDARQGKALNDLISALQSTVAGKLSKSDVSVETRGDGTVDINVGSEANKDNYTINLNHTHEGMARLVVDTAANLPDASEMESDTIYGELDDGEIATIYLGGYPFYGGGGGASSGPGLRSPADDSTIDMGNTVNGSASYQIKVKGKGLTQALTIELDGTGFSFGTTQPSGVTRDSATQLTIPASSISAVNSLNGVSIEVVYTGSDMDDNAEGTLGITSSTPDNVSTDVTLLVNKVDADGLIGLWNSADAAQNGAWVDRINGMKLNLGGSAAKVSDGYQINNLSSVRNAWLYLDGSNLTLMNTEIDKVFTCVVDCLVKFSAANMMAEIIDFGGLGSQLSDVTLRVYATQDGLLKNTVKYNGQIVNPYEQDKNIGAFTLNTYVPIRLVCGAKYSADGTMQILYGIVNSQQVSSVITPPATINFRGCSHNQTTLPYAFGMGLLYYPESADRDLPGYKADIIYKRVMLYNKIKTL